ncbi:hypothetical protein MAM1_0295d09351, partial [Mucor ambiguus]
MADSWYCILGVSVLFTAAVAVHLLPPLWCSLLVLAAAAAVVHLLFWRCSLL